MDGMNAHRDTVDASQQKSGSVKHPVRRNGEQGAFVREKVMEQSQRRMAVQMAFVCLRADSASRNLMLSVSLVGRNRLRARDHIGRDLGLGRRS